MGSRGLGEGRRIKYEVSSKISLNNDFWTVETEEWGGESGEQAQGRVREARHTG